MKSATTPIIETVEGLVQGIVEEDVFAYKGIPYAKPPVGGLRWREPQPVEHWGKNVLEANAYKNSCWQDKDLCTAAGGGDPGTMSEDCLYLNVWTPKRDEQTTPAPLPVMVWIHGGAFLIGGGGLPPYHGAPIVKRGAILVTFNYRLGALGFFSHDALKKEVTTEGRTVNNFGLLDQIAVLKWVHRNISRFGGDPGNVTIFGQSAGARSVLAMFCSPLATTDEGARLFHRGIAQSVYRNPDLDQAEARKRGHKLANLVGVTDANATPELLRAVDADKLMNIATPPDPDPFKGTVCGPSAIFGDAVLPKGTFATFLAHEEAPLPLIIGNTSDDGSVVRDSLPKELFIYNNIPLLRKPGEKHYADLKDEVPVNKVEADRRLGRDVFFTAVTDKLAESHRQIAPTWRYYYEYTAQNLVNQFPGGPRHGDDVIFTMNTGAHAPLLPPPAEAEFTPADQAVADKISEYWFEFARTGQPVCKDGPAWPVQEANADAPTKDTKTLRVDATITVATDFMKAQMPAFEASGDWFDTLMVIA